MINRPTIRQLLYGGLLVHTFALSPVHAFAQTGIERVLTAVEQNNRTLRAEGLAQAARRAELRTGLAPDNPFVEYDYLPGRPEGSGVQHQFSLTQSLDLPVVYRQRREVARRQTEQTTPQQRVVRQGVLLEAKRLCLELIYHNIRQADLQARLRRASELAAGVREQVRGGTATALDVSKADLARLGLENDLRQNAHDRQQRTLRLAGLNGGEVINVPDTTYPALPPLPAFAVLDSLIELADPTLAVVQQQVGIDRQQLELTRARTLPRFELGYHFQSLLGVRYGGVHAGLTLPLWQQRNTVAAGQAAVVASEGRVIDHRTEHLARNRQLYEQVQTLQTNLAQYGQALGTTNPLPLLDTAFRLRQLTVVSYILETTYLYNATDTLRQLERDVQLTLADLLAYQL
jgi:outer membrane protein, heavy metal efflux system